MREKRSEFGHFTLSLFTHPSNAQSVILIRTFAHSVLILYTVVGLTGGIASGTVKSQFHSFLPQLTLLTGKSTVSALLETTHNLPLIDLDLLARLAVAPNSYALSALVAHFGPTILLESGALNRQVLGDLIFADEKERKILNSIVHPAVRRLLAWELIKAWMRGEKVVIVDAPLLIEAGLWKFCGAIVVVYWFVTLSLRHC